LEEVSFLSQGFVFNKRINCWLPVPETAKVLSSLMYGANVDDVRWHYLRACALRIDSYASVEVRNVLQKYITFLDREYSKQFIGEVNGVSIMEIRNVWKSDAAIEALYGGLESSDACKNLALLKIILDQDLSLYPSTSTESFESYSPKFSSLFEIKQSFQMGKTPAQKAQRKAAKKQRKQAMSKRARKPNKKKPNRGNSKMGLGKKRSPGVKGNFMSLVSDGVNVGSVWKNTTAERVTFPIAREKFADLTSTGTTFQTLVQQFVNPGNTQLFPIFSNIAKNYEEYIPNTLKLYYRTEEYMASGTNVSAGLAALGINFDPDAPNFATITELENYEHSISGAPFSGIMCLDVLEHHKKRFKGKSRDLSLNNYFVNYSNNSIAPGSTPAKFYDIGNLQLDVNGTQAGIIGELWIEYSFTLIRRLQQPGAPLGGVAHFSSIAATTANNFAAAALQTGSTLNGITLGINTLIFPAGIPGEYFVYCSVAGATSATAITWNAAGNGVNIFTQSAVRDAATQQDSLAGTTTAPAMAGLTVNCPNAGFTATLTPSTITGTGSMDLFIFSLPAAPLLNVEQKEIDTLRAQVAKQDSLLERLITRLDSLDGLSAPKIRRKKMEIEECKSDDDESPDELDKSIHISREVAEKLFRSK